MLEQGKLPSGNELTNGKGFDVLGSDEGAEEQELSTSQLKQIPPEILIEMLWLESVPGGEPFPLVYDSLEPELMDIDWDDEGGERDEDEDEFDDCYGDYLDEEPDTYPEWEEE